MYFYLKEPKAEKETPIIIQYYVKNDPPNFKYSTKEKIHPKDWNFEQKLPFSIKGAGGVKLKKIKSNILKYDNFLERVINNASFNNTPLTRIYLKAEFDQNFKKATDQPKNFKHFTDFVDDFVKKTPNLINRNTKKKYTSKKISDYKITLAKLIEFEKHDSKKIKINDFNIDVYDRLIEFLKDNKNYATNYIGKIIKNTKVFLKKAEESNYTVNADYKKNEFAVLKEDTIAVALSETEIDLIAKHDFTDNKKLQNCRDLAIIGLWTGLRVSDFLKLPEIKPSDIFITVQPQKTLHSSGVKVVIPLHHHIKEMIQKRGMPKSISDVKFNEYVKLVCKEVGIKSLVKGSLMDEESKRKKIDIYEKYKLISSHTCRRSFATNLYKSNFPTLSIMKITGHTSEKIFLTYIKVTPKEHAEKLLLHWNDYYSR